MNPCATPVKNCLTLFLNLPPLRFVFGFLSGSIVLLVDDDELERRRADWKPDEPRYDRGYAKLYVDHVLQAHQGADLDFLVGKDTRPVTRESH